MAWIVDLTEQGFLNMDDAQKVLLHNGQFFVFMTTERKLYFIYAFSGIKKSLFQLLQLSFPSDHLQLSPN